VKSADTKSLTKIGEEIRELAGRAREGRLKPSEFTGGSFSVSNLGMFAVDSFSAILNPPQGAIMAVGRGVESVSIDSDGNLIGTPSFSITVSADARVADAADVALFLKTFKNVFENPEGGEGVGEWLL
jgi:pyruvate/2-oxoglutarate dehydrogenase complex dihydrolipoamide acyltransferase (E2) component